MSKLVTDDVLKEAVQAIMSKLGGGSEPSIALLAYPIGSVYMSFKCSS